MLDRPILKRSSTEKKEIERKRAKRGRDDSKHTSISHEWSSAFIPVAARGNIDYRTLHNPRTRRGNMQGCRVRRWKMGGYATRVFGSFQLSFRFRTGQRERATGLPSIIHKVLLLIQQTAMTFGKFIEAGRRARYTGYPKITRANI